MPKIILNGKEYGNNKPDGYPPIIYSDEEREVGVWRNGKPLYEKTLIPTLLTSDTADEDFTIPNVDEIVSCDGRISNAANTLCTTTPFMVVDAYRCGFQANVLNSTTVRCRSYFGSQSSSYKIKTITLRYTKTTDVAGSGKWTTQGTPTHHYSTNEQVIGTWVDGKPLYEKTWDLGSSGLTISYNSWTASNIPKAGIEVIAYARATNQTGGAYFGDVMVSRETDNTYISFQTARNNNNTEVIRYVTLQYTKTTD